MLLALDQAEKESAAAWLGARQVADMVSVSTQMPRGLNPFAQAFVPAHGAQQPASFTAGHFTSALSSTVRLVDLPEEVSPLQCKGPPGDRSWDCLVYLLQLLAITINLKRTVGTALLHVC